MSGDRGRPRSPENLRSVGLAANIASGFEDSEEQGRHKAGRDGLH